MVGLMLDKIQMNNAELTSWRNNQTKVLAKVETDVEWIKDNISRMDARQDNLTQQVSWIRGMGSIVGIILGSVLALVSSIVF